MAFESASKCFLTTYNNGYFDGTKMLTDEDIQLGAQDFMDVSFESQNILNCFTNELQYDSSSLNGNLDSLDFNYNLDFTTSFDDFLKKEVESEPSSPSSTDVSSPDNTSSIISIPDEESDCGVNGIIADTPPQTPPGLAEQVSNSPPRSSVNPIIVSMNTVPTLTYVVPVTPLTVAPLTKPCKNIQPKPIHDCVENGNGIPGQEVLKPEELVLQKSLYQVKQVQKRGRKKKVVCPQEESEETNLIERCAAALKRQEKMMKNRESATLSRMRKREYVQKLEEQLNQLTSENSNLRLENCQLKIRVTDLEREILKLKTAFLSTGLKKTTCVFVAVFMLTFNLASFGSIFDRTQPKPLGANVENHRVGRILLWNEENTSRELNSSDSLLHDSFIKDDDDSSYIVSWDKSYNLSSCQQYINKSESLRLEKDLLGWVKRVEKKQKQNESKFRGFAVDMKGALPLPKLQQLGLRQRSDKDIWAKKKSRNDISVTGSPDQGAPVPPPFTSLPLSC